MTRTVTILFEEPVNDMAREEILKQVPQLSAALKMPHIPPDGSRLEFEIPAEQADPIRLHAERLCNRIRRPLQRIERKVVYQTRGVAHPCFKGRTGPDFHDVGIYPTGEGLVSLEGVSLQLFRYFDSAVARLDRGCAPHQLLTPTLIPAHVL